MAFDYRFRASLAALVALAALPAAPQAPGEDPVVLRGRQETPLHHGSPAQASGTFDGQAGIPSWMRARIARFEAKAFSADTTGILTDNDVVKTSAAQGLHKTCVQEIGSNTVAPGTQLAGQSQVVVLRGDLVNICK